MRDVAQDPAEFDNLWTQFGGYRRLLRGRIEQLTALAAIVVYFNTEGGAHLVGPALDDGPVLAGLPSHGQALATRPADQLSRLGRVAQFDGQLGVVAVRGSEIG